MICSNCGCLKELHTEPSQHQGWGPGCSVKKDPNCGGSDHSKSVCWGGFDTAPGGSHPRTCTHKNGCKQWCPNQTLRPPELPPYFWPPDPQPEAPEDALIDEFAVKSRRRVIED